MLRGCPRNHSINSCSGPNGLRLKERPEVFCESSASTTCIVESPLPPRDPYQWLYDIMTTRVKIQDLCCGFFPQMQVFSLAGRRTRFISGPFHSSARFTKSCRIGFMGMYSIVSRTSQREGT